MLGRGRAFPRTGLTLEKHHLKDGGKWEAGKKEEEEEEGEGEEEEDVMGRGT